MSARHRVPSTPRLLLVGLAAIAVLVVCLVRAPAPTRASELPSPAPSVVEELPLTYVVLAPLVYP